MRGLLHVALLMLLCAALYLPGLVALPPVDRDEARYAQATRQMLATGDLIVPQVQGTRRLNKPIGIYWLQAAAVGLADAPRPTAIAIHRIPSVLGALAAVLGTYAIGRRWFAPPAACLGAALLAASALLVVEAHLATTDAVLLACIVAAQGCLAALDAAVRRGDRGSASVAVGFWLAQAAGILVKGPVAPVVSGLTIAALAVSLHLVRRRAVSHLRVAAGLVPAPHRRPTPEQASGGGGRPQEPPLPGRHARQLSIRRLLVALRPWWGVPLLAACVAPWVIAVGARAGWDALPGAMAGDIVPKLAGAHESHGAPPGLYLLLAPLTFWPGSLALVFALVMAWRRRRRPGERFLLAWLVPTWLVFECLPTKLPNYVLPAFPALALLAARAALTAPVRLRPPIRHVAIRALAIGWAALTVGVGGAALAAAFWLGWPVAGTGGPTAWAGIGAAALVMLATVGLAARCLQRVWRGELAAAAWTAALAAVLVYAPFLQCVLPRLDALWPSRAAAAAVARAGAHRPLAAVGYGEPSLVFLTRADIAWLDADAAAAFLSDRPDGLVLVTGEQVAELTAGARQRGVAVRNLWSDRALNYSTGDWIDLHLLGSYQAR